MGTIIIPSKNIYDVQDNKIIDNKIVNISAEIVDAVANEKKTDLETIFTANINNDGYKYVLQDTLPVNKTNDDAVGSLSDGTYAGSARLQLTPILWEADFSFDIPQFTSSLSQVTSLDKDDIKIKYIFDIYKREIDSNKSKAQVVNYIIDDSVIYIVDREGEEENVPEDVTVLIYYTNDLSYKGEVEMDGLDANKFNFTVSKSDNNNNKIQITVKETNFPSQELLTSATIILNKDKKVYEYRATNALSGFNIFQYGALYSNARANRLVNIEGSYIEYRLKRMVLEFRSPTIAMGDRTTTEITIGNALDNRYVFEYPTNELLQKANLIAERDENGYATLKNQIDVMLNDTIKQYSKGKETATLLCDINEYYDESGNLAISTQDNDLSMTFNIGDKVVPMVYSANGTDVPMSRYNNGEQKVFTVIGTKMIYDGAVWQEITLLEE